MMNARFLFSQKYLHYECQAFFESTYTDECQAFLQTVQTVMKVYMVENSVLNLFHIPVNNFPIMLTHFLD